MIRKEPYVWEDGELDLARYLESKGITVERRPVNVPLTLEEKTASQVISEQIAFLESDEARAEWQKQIAAH